MRFTWIIAVIAAVILTACPASGHGRKLSFRRLSASQVYRALREAGREDAIPEGRVITQGIAALTGFTLGLTKGVGGAMLVDLALSNTTREWLNNLNITWLPGSSNTGAPAPTQTQEICFGSRSLNDVDDKEDEDQAQARQAAGTTPGTTTGTAPAPTSPPSVPAITSTVASPGGTAIATGTATATGTVSNTVTPSATFTSAPTGSTVTSPAATNTATGTGTATTGNTGTGTMTNTNTLTDTGPSKPVTCIVVQKPSARKRRSTSTARRRRAARRQH